MGSEMCIRDRDIDNGSYDPDGDPLTISLDKDTFTCADLGANAVTLTVSDGELTDTCIATVTVVDTTPPVVSILSPVDGDTYTNTQGPIPVEYTAQDTCDPSLDITMFLDDSIFSGESINLCGIESGEHTLVVNATDDSGNVGEASVIFYIEPQPLESFVISHMTIHWVHDVGNADGKGKVGSKLKKRLTKKGDTFSVSGRLQLPGGYTVADLQKSATVTLSLIHI